MASDNLVNITINDESLRRSLRALDLAATDLEPAMRKIAGTLLAETQFNFLDEGRPGWTPSLAAEERDGQTLQDTGRLMGSVSTDHDDRQELALMSFMGQFTSSVVKRGVMSPSNFRPVRSCR